MSHTEQEAREKWCPFARIPGRVVAGDNHVLGFASQNRGMAMGGTLEPCMCVASKCMAWRKGPTIGVGPNGEKHDRDLDGRTTWLETGYCGLAGSPS